MDKRLDGVAKAQVATRLAAVYLMDHKPTRRVATIRDSQITGLPDQEMHAAHAAGSARLRRPQAMGQCARPDRGGPGRRHQAAARRHLLGKRQLGASPARRSEELLGNRWSDPAPADRRRARTRCLRAAVAYSLANDETSLARLRDHFAPKMKGTPDANLFAVLSADIDQHGLAFRDAAAQIASVDTLEVLHEGLHQAQGGREVLISMASVATRC